MSLLKYRGSANFRQRIAFSTLSGRPIRIDDIRSESDEPGLRDFEASFLRLVDKITNGANIEINETGTTLRYAPGLLIGGRIEHDCGDKRSVGWFLEGILVLAPFAKTPISMVLKGITNDNQDVGVDRLKSVTLPLMKHFGLEEGGEMQLKIKKRGAPPNGGGEIFVKLPTVKALKPIDLLNEGFVKRIRGVAYATKVSPQIPNRIVESARGTLNQFIPDVYIFVDHYKGAEGGMSPGFGLSLVAETTEGALLSIETVAEGGMLPEDLGAKGAAMLCEEISKGGYIDSDHQWLPLTLMALCPEDVSKVRTGPLTTYSVATLRLLRDFFGVVFKVTPQELSDSRGQPEQVGEGDGSAEDAKSTDEGEGMIRKTVVLSCVGSGYKNMARKVC